MDNRPIRYLTPSQIKQYYAEYVSAKRKNIAGDIMSQETWTNEMETYLDRHAKQTGPTYSKTAIKEAQRKMLLRDHFTDKQFTALAESFKKALKDGDDEASAMWVELKKKYPHIDPYNMRANAGQIYQFLKNYSGDWNEYFNS